jgi:2-dehydropantoate 2-reductase
MRVAIIGAGALGSILGGLLIEAGLDVVLVQRDKEMVKAVKNNGLRLEGASGDRVLHAEIVSDPSEAGKVDLAIVTVKAYDTATAIPAIKAVVADEGIVLTLQNGIGNYEILEESFPGRALLGTTTNGALALGDGAFRHTGIGQTHFGEPDGTIKARTRQVADLLDKAAAGPVHIVENAQGCVWSKLIVNAAINGPATLLRVRNGDLPKSEAGQALIHDIVSECIRVVKAKGISLIFDDPETQVLAVCEATAANLNSMFQDILTGKRTEIDYINLAIAREAEIVEIPTPVNRTIGFMIKALESTADLRVLDTPS